MPMVTYGSKKEKDTEQKRKHEERCKHEEVCECPETAQTHNHEYEGSTKLAEENDDRHNHRFACVTTEMICRGEHHVHAFMNDTDFLDHHHEMGGTTGIEIPVGNGKHVHFASDMTSCDDGHFHDFQFATLIDAPLV